MSDPYEPKDYRPFVIKFFKVSFTIYMVLVAALIIYSQLQGS